MHTIINLILRKLRHKERVSNLYEDTQLVNYRTGFERRKSGFGVPTCMTQLYTPNERNFIYLLFIYIIYNYLLYIFILYIA